MTWVFILDADEVLPPETEAEFRKIVAGNGGRPGTRSGYWINRRFMFMDRWLAHAYFPNWNLRLFRHALGRYEKLTDADTRSGDNEVHEHVIVQGKTGHLTSRRDGSLRVPIGRDVRGEAQPLFQLGGARGAGPLPARQRRRVAKRTGRCAAAAEGVILTAAVPTAAAVSVRLRLAAGRSSTGREGYYFARLHGFYEFLSVAKTFELKKDARIHRKKLRRVGRMKILVWGINYAPESNGDRAV